MSYSNPSFHTHPDTTSRQNSNVGHVLSSSILPPVWASSITHSDLLGLHLDDRFDYIYRPTIYSNPLMGCAARRREYKSKPGSTWIPSCAHHPNFELRAGHLVLLSNNLPSLHKTFPHTLNQYGSRYLRCCFRRCCHERCFWSRHVLRVCLFLYFKTCQYLQFPLAMMLTSWSVISTTSNWMPVIT